MPGYSHVLLIVHIQSNVKRYLLYKTPRYLFEVVIEVNHNVISGNKLQKQYT